MTSWKPRCDWADDDMQDDSRTVTWITCEQPATIVSKQGFFCERHQGMGQTEKRPIEKADLEWATDRLFNSLQNPRALFRADEVEHMLEFARNERSKERP
jgi:hypothetical protein